MFGHRWTPTRKEQVVVAALSGSALADLVAEHAVPSREIEEWIGLYTAHGLRGLYVTGGRVSADCTHLVGA